MTTEKFANLGESTLTIAYTSGGGSITVASATTFPTAGDFRVRLVNPSETLLRVTAISGTTFTVTAEENDGDADPGDAVVHVATRAVAERWLQSNEADEQRAPSGVSAADFYGLIHKLTALDQSGWSWVNQGSFTVTQSDGNVELEGPAAAGVNLRARVVTAPSPPYTITVGLKAWLGHTSAAHTIAHAAGVLFRESGTGEITVFMIANFLGSTFVTPPSLWTGNYNSPTSFNALLNERSSILIGRLMWLRITDNNTNLIFEASIDKVHWYTLTTIGRTSFMAGGPDQVGIVAYNEGGSVDVSGLYLSWEES